MDRDPAHIVTYELDLATVQAYAYLQATGAASLRDRPSASDCPSRAIERGEGTVAQVLHLASAESRQIASHRRMVCREQLAPACVPEFPSPLRGADDVGEHQGGEHALGLGY